MNTFTTANEYISSLPGVVESTPVKVTIGNEVYENACRYKRQFGEQDAAGKYIRTMVYVVGLLPKCADRNTAYTVEGDPIEWYLTGGAYGIRKADRRKPMPVTEYNPFGNFFQLAPWEDENTRPSYKGQKIDEYEPKKYQRVALKIENV